MGIKLQWPSQSAKGVSGLEIYRGTGSTSTLNRNSLPAPLTTLAADATSFEDTTVVEKTIYNYWVCSVKNGERVFTNPIQRGYYLDTGPGPADLKFGNWDAGYFGTVAVTDLFTHLEINGQIGTTVSQYTADVYHKFIYKGRILFYPNIRTTTFPWNTLYSAGVAWGSDAVAYIKPNGPANTPQGRTVTKNGRSYILRLPFVADYSVVGGATLNNDTLANQGEWRNTMERLFNANGQMPRWGSVTTESAQSDLGLYTTQFAQAYGTSNVWKSYGYAPQNIYAAVPTSNISSMQVLELVLP